MLSGATSTLQRSCSSTAAQMQAFDKQQRFCTWMREASRLAHDLLSSYSHAVSQPDQKLFIPTLVNELVRQEGIHLSSLPLLKE